MEPLHKAPRASVSASRVVDVQQLLEEQPVGRFQILVLLMCMFIVTLDGLDIVMVGFIAPALSSAWAIPRDAFGPVMSGGLLGLAFGALFQAAGTVGSLAIGWQMDRFNPHRALGAATVLLKGARHRGPVLQVSAGIGH